MTSSALQVFASMSNFIAETGHTPRVSRRLAALSASGLKASQISMLFRWGAAKNMDPTELLLFSYMKSARIGVCLYPQNALPHG